MTRARMILRSVFVFVSILSCSRSFVLQGGRTEVDNQVSNVGYGGIGLAVPRNFQIYNIYEASGYEHGDYLDPRQAHPNTGLGVLACPRVDDRVPMLSGGTCPRGWTGYPECEDSDVDNLQKCEWEEEVEVEFPKKKVMVHGLLCNSRRMSCLKEAGVIPGNIELIHAPKNTLFDQAELAETFSHLKKLISVDLSRNDFTHLSVKTFLGNPCLRSVNFDLNFLLDIPQLIFAKNRILTSVSFVGNKLDYIPPRLFFMNPILTIVDFERNNITLIPPEVFRRNVRLEVVRLTGNSIPNIPAALFSANPYLREVSLAHNRISVIPKSLFHSSKNLRNVFMNGNKIKKIPENFFDNCRELRTLALDHNMISTLPTKLFELNKKLMHINLSYNRFHVVSRELFINNPVVVVVNQQWKDHKAQFQHEEDEDVPRTNSLSKTPNLFRKFVYRGK